MSENYVVGVDGGTEALKVDIFDLAGGVVATNRVEYPTGFPSPGHAEQNPADWWDALVRGVHGSVAMAGIDPDAIRAICIAATSCTLVFLDDDGVPLRPALMWMDVRAADEAVTISRCGAAALRASGGQSASPEWMPSKALWMRNNEPEVYRRTAWIAEYNDYLAWRLTGRRAASRNTAGMRSYYGLEGQSWPHDLFTRIGLPDLAEKLPDSIVPMGRPIASLQRSAAAELGLSEAVVVVAGGADAFVGQVGLGAVEPGDLSLITGSSHLMLLQSSDATFTPGLFGAYPDVTVAGQYTVEGGQAATGSMVDWFRRMVGGGRAQAEIFAELTAAARELPPGSGGLVVLDHWQGNRTPYVDGNSRGVIAGLTLSHRPEHLFRALMESVCYGTANTIDVITAAGHDVDRIIACGGVLHSEFWMQMHADVLGRPIEVTENPEAVALGAGILAAVGAGLFADVHESVAAMVRTARRIEPDPDVHAAYREFREQYRALYQANHDINHFLAHAQRYR